VTTVVQPKQLKGTKTYRLAYLRARRGAALLDAIFGPGWRQKINRKRLRMAGGYFNPFAEERGNRGCILAQLSAADRASDGYYGSGLSKIGLREDRKQTTLGFMSEPGKATFKQLDSAWKRVLRESA
jgi:hypothetical protein